MMFVVGRRELLFSSSGFRCILRRGYSKSPVSQCVESHNSHFMVDYLVDSLHFSRKEAISVSEKVSRLKSTQNSKLVVDFFKQQCGLDITQIRDIVSRVPQFLLRNVHQTLEPKIRVFQDLGLSGSDLAKFIKMNPVLLRRNLDTHIVPTVSYMRKVLGSDENLVKAIKTSSWFLSSKPYPRMELNLQLLHNVGFSNDSIIKLILRFPNVMVAKPEWIQDVVDRVEGELGIPRHSPMFIYGTLVLGTINKKKLQMKLEMFRSYGWSDSDFYAMARNQPNCLGTSDAKTRNGLNFFMKELGYTPQYLSSHPILLMFNLEKRVKARNQVLEILKENKLVKPSLCLYTVVLLSELKFLQNYVLRYKDDIPDLYKNYIKSLK